MSGHCKKCGVYHEEDDDRLCPSCQQGRCPSVHIWSDQQCIRQAGHDGFCYGKAQAGSAIIRRAEWISENGKFKSHHQYATIYPRNAE